MYLCKLTRLMLNLNEWIILFPNNTFSTFIIDKILIKWKFTLLYTRILEFIVNQIFYTTVSACTRANFTLSGIRRTLRRPIIFLWGIITNNGTITLNSQGTAS